MTTLTQTSLPKNTASKPVQWLMTAEDRCDTGNCGAQAYVMVTGVTGSLSFCAHHYNHIVDNAVGYDKIMKFAYEILDERDKLIENRLIGDD